MNILEFNKKSYKYESFWRKQKRTIIYDANNKPLPWPNNRKKWQNQNNFINKMKSVETYLRRKNNFKRYDKSYNKNCLICGQKNINTGLFEINRIRWESGLKHYIIKHNVKPSNEFIDFIFRLRDYDKIGQKRILNVKGTKFKKYNKNYLKIDRNQILIMDALFKHGSYKIYSDEKNKRIHRYSEHAGLLDFNRSVLEKIIVSGNTSRVDDNDNDIFLPQNIPEAFDYEYIFHTHPATPTPGGRANLGILYEFPSMGDIFHFIDHYNEGNTQGSIVIAAEGMYIVRKSKFDDNAINFNEDIFFDKISRLYTKLQKSAIKKYGTDFSSYYFYSKIAQDKKYINILNKTLKKYGLYIDFYHRIKDMKKRWIIDTVYLPIYSTEPVNNI